MWRKIDKHGVKVIAPLLLFYIIYVAWRQTYHLDNYARYTVCYIEDTPLSGHLVRKVDYFFYIKGVKYDGGKNNHGAIMGKRYVVKYSFRDPSINEILQDRIVPDSVMVIPDTGWSYIPSFIIN